MSPQPTLDAAPSPVTAALLDLSGIAHGFFTREGGVSGGIHAGLNVGLGSSDALADVTENRRRIARALGARVGAGADDVVTPYQIHSATVVTVDAPFPADVEEKPRADAVVTATPGLPIGVVTADCGPVLFADPEARIVGAAHAGWKGAVGGVVEETVAAMERLGSARGSIRAALGPTISQAAYEVGPEFVERFEASERDRYFVASSREEHAMFDLPLYILDRLERLGVAATWTGHCTYADPALFSYRRATHRAEPSYGRQMSAIMLLPQ